MVPRELRHIKRVSLENTIQYNLIQISVCKKDSRFIANEFRLKFPINLWRNGKESLLADLLAARLEDCFTKAESGYWNRVNDLINGLSLTTT